MKAKTLFIIGAGASSEARLPLARQLADVIATRLDIRVTEGRLAQVPDPELFDVIQDAARPNNINAWLNAAWLVRDGVVYSNSIDSFLDNHVDNDKVQYCGKLAIARTILEAEQKSLLYTDDAGRSFQGAAQLNDTWFVTLFRNLVDGVRRAEVGRLFEDISFIVFNYDRCVEHFFYHALQAHYEIENNQASALMNTLRIYHPYGAISPLQWQSDSGIPFGFPANRANLQQMITCIKTYTEQIEDRELVAALRQEVETAHTLVCAGLSHCSRRGARRFAKRTRQCAAQERHRADQSGRIAVLRSGTRRARRGDREACSRIRAVRAAAPNAMDE